MVNNHLRIFFHPAVHPSNHDIHERNGIKIRDEIFIDLSDVLNAQTGRDFIDNVIHSRQGKMIKVAHQRIF